MFVELKGTDQAALDRAMAEFKSKIKRSGLFEELKRHEYHVKPSVRRKLKQQEAFKRRRREENARVKNKGTSPRGSSQNVESSGIPLNESAKRGDKVDTPHGVGQVLAVNAPNLRVQLASGAVVNVNRSRCIVKN